MGRKSGTRKLAAILATDVVGYTRLMGIDETGTQTRMTAHLDEAFRPAISEHQGRVVKTTGDGLLAEFDSAVEAVECAVQIQTSMAERVAEEPEDRRVIFRIGINLGDIVVQDADIYGDGVNVAARIESLADPGGIFISQSVADQISGRLDTPLEDIGAHEFKNVRRPVHVFRVLLDGAKPGHPVAGAVKAKLKRRIAAIVMAGLLVVGIAAAALWPFLESPTGSPPSSGETAPALSSKPSVAVLPFVNTSGEVEQEYFSDGITEDLITDLSKVSGLIVIARNSTFAYKGKSPDVRDVANELGVRYVLEGSVRKAGDRVRVNAQLIDGATGAHMWADRYDGNLTDIFDLQDKVTEKIVSVLALKLTEDEKAQIAKKETNNLEAYDEFLKGWEQQQLRSPEGFRLAIEHYNNAIALDPEYSRVYAALASTYWEVYNRYWHGEIGLLSLHEPMYLAETMLENALKEPTPLALQISALLYSRQGFHNDAVADAERAVSLDPNDADGYVTQASVLTLAGEPEKAIELIQKAMRLNPHFPSGYLYELGLAHFTSGQYSKAAEALERASALSPEDSWPNRLLIAVYGQLDRQADVDRMMNKNRLYHLGFDSLTIKSIAFWYPFKKPEHANRLAEGLRKAGVPD